MLSVWSALGKGTRLPFQPLKSLNLRRITLMNEDSVIGNAKNVGGRVKEGLGRATGDVKSQLQGKAKQVEGAAQDVYGQVKETASDAVEAIRESARGAEDSLRTTIEERPYTADRRCSWNRIPDWPLQPPRQLLDARRSRRG